MSECSCECPCCVSRRLRSVYALIDPRTSVIRYVGQARDPHKRLAAHKKASARRVKEWLADLEEEGVSPILEVLAVVDGEAAALEREQQWIEALNRVGPPLLNVAGTRNTSRRTSRTVLVSFRLHEETIAQIKQMAEERGVTQSTIVREAIEWSMRRVEAGEELFHAA